MKRVAILSVMAALFVSAGCSQSASQQTATTVESSGTDHPEAPAVIAVAQQLFDALEAGDVDLLERVVDPSVVMHFSEVSAAGDVSFGSSTREALGTRITTAAAPLIERMWDPEVRIDGNLATLWTPYDFYVGEELSHCGMDAFTLLKGDEGWRIVGLSWTRHQPPTCDLHPDGPPASQTP